MEFLDLAHDQDSPLGVDDLGASAPPRPCDVGRAVDLLSSGVDEADVRAVCPRVDLLSRPLAELVQWHRQARAGAARLTPDYVAVRAMAELDGEAPDPKAQRAADGKFKPKPRRPEANTRARLLQLVVRSKG